MSHSHGDVGLQLDEDNVFVASDDEDETPQSSSSEHQMGLKRKAYLWKVVVLIHKL